MPRKEATKVTRVSVGTMLLEQEKTAKAVQAHFKEAGAKVAAEADKKRRGDRERRAGLMAALLLASPALVARVKESLVAGRQGARLASSKRLVRELAGLGLSLSGSDLGKGRPAIIAGEAARRWADEVSADIAAQSLVAQWRGVAAFEAASGARKDMDVAEALSKTPLRMKARIERTVDTEIAQSYNDEHRQILEDAVRYDDELQAELDGRRIVREWSALVDACARCWPLDGQQAEIGESFPSGDVPGDVHVRCRCIEFYTTAS